MFVKAQLQNRTDDLWFLLKCLVEEIQDDVLLKIDDKFYLEEFTDSYDEFIRRQNSKIFNYDAIFQDKDYKNLINRLNLQDLFDFDKFMETSAQRQRVREGSKPYKGPRAKITGKNPFLDSLSEEHKKAFYDKFEDGYARIRGIKGAADAKRKAEKFIKEMKLSMKSLSSKYPNLSTLDSMPLYSALAYNNERFKNKKEVLDHLNEVEKKLEENSQKIAQGKSPSTASLKEIAPQYTTEQLNQLVMQIGLDKKLREAETIRTNKTGLEIFEILEGKNEVKVLRELLEDDDYKKFLNRLSQNVKIESIVDSKGNKKQKEKIAIEQTPRRYLEMYQSISTLLDAISQDADIKPSTQSKVSRIRKILDKRFTEMKVEAAKKKVKGDTKLRIESAKEVPKTTIDFWNNLRGELIIIKNNIEGKSIEEIRDEGGIRLKQLISSLVGLAGEGVVLEIINNIIPFGEKEKFDWYQYKFNNSSKKMQKIESRYVSSSKGYEQLEAAITSTKELLTDKNKKSSLLENINKITLFTGIKNPFSDRKISSISRVSPKQAKERAGQIARFSKELKDFGVSRSTVRKITKLKGGTKKIREIIQTIPVSLAGDIFGKDEAFNSLEDYLLSWNVISSAGNFFNEETDTPKNVKEGKDIGLNLDENLIDALLAGVKKVEKKKTITTENKSALRKIREKANKLADELEKISIRGFDKFIEDAQRTNANIRKYKGEVEKLMRQAEKFKSSLEDLNKRIKNYKKNPVGSLENLKQAKAKAESALSRIMNLIERPSKELRAMYDEEGKPIVVQGKRIGVKTDKKTGKTKDIFEFGRIKTEEITSKNINERRDMQIQFAKSLFKKRYGVDLPTQQEMDKYEKKQKQIEAYSVLLKDTISEHKEVVKEIEKKSEEKIKEFGIELSRGDTLSDERIKGLETLINRIKYVKTPNKQEKINTLKKLIKIHTEEKEKWLAMDKEERQNWYETQIMGIKETRRKSPSAIREKEEKEDD